MKLFKGDVASHGIAVASAHVFEVVGEGVLFEEGVRRLFASQEERKKAEFSRFERACLQVSVNLEASSARVRRQLGEDAAEIFEAHQMFLEDEETLRMLGEALEAEDVCAEEALLQTLERCKAPFLAMEDDYLRQRVIDLQDVWFQVLSELRGEQSVSSHGIGHDVILVARQLFPSTLARFDFGQLKGIVTEEGGKTSHIAILAHSLGIPYLVGVQGVQGKIESGQLLALDGERGLLYVEPDYLIESKYRAKQVLWLESQRELESWGKLPARMSCGSSMCLRANLNFLHSLESVQRVGAEGVGLFRTEFLFMDRDELPGEESQYQLYLKAVEAISPDPVTFRILDIGGDKQLSYFPLPEEENPQLGWRGIRVSLAHDELLLPQLQALLRASAHGPLRIMVPVLSSVEELKAFLRMFEVARRRVEKRGLSMAEKIPLGLMIETPSAALILDLLGEEIDFFSVGTNDLLQLLMGADRNNAQVSHLTSPLQPAMLRLLKQLCVQAGVLGKPISVCGEMASDPLYTSLLVGLGFRELSVASRFVPSIKRRLSLFALEEAQRLVEEMMSKKTSRGLLKLLNDFESGLGAGAVGG